MLRPCLPLSAPQCAPSKNQTRIFSGLVGQSSDEEDSNNPEETQEVAPYRSDRGTQVVQAFQLPNNEAAKNGLLATDQRSIQAGRPAIAKWIDATPIDDHHALGKLRPILADLRAAESILNAIVPPYNA